MPEFEQVLARRAATAREAWSSHFKSFRNAGAETALDWESAGGLKLAGIEWGHLEATHPALYRILLDEGVIAARHSHGGRYFFADPCLYVRARPWRALRQQVDARLASTLAAMPEFVLQSDVGYFEWRGMISVLEMVRTDLCSVLWNELCIRGWSTESKIEVGQLMTGLKWSSSVIIKFLPPLNVEHKRPDVVDLRQPFMRSALRYGSALPHVPNERAMRSRRASDALFLVWSSLARLISKVDNCRYRYWVFGNAFGAIDLAFYVSEALHLSGVEDVTASLCKVGRHPTVGHPSEEDVVLWPMGSSAPDIIIFCDDSISSGSSYFRFKSISQGRYPTARLLPFFLSYDLSPQWNDHDAAPERFALAWCATARAPWSQSMKARPDAVANVDDLIAAMASSSDEQLRWIGLTQGSTIRELNATDDGKSAS
jgi:hypothetical protein